MGSMLFEIVKTIHKKRENASVPDRQVRSAVAL